MSNKNPPKKLCGRRRSDVRALLGKGPGKTLRGGKALSAGGGENKLQPALTLGVLCYVQPHGDVPTFWGGETAPVTDGSALAQILCRPRSVGDRDDSMMK